MKEVISEIVLIRQTTLLVLILVESHSGIKIKVLPKARCRESQQRWVGH